MESSFPTRRLKSGSAALRSSAHRVEWSEVLKRRAEGVRAFLILDADGNLLTFEEAAELNRSNPSEGN